MEEVVGQVQHSHLRKEIWHLHRELGNRLRRITRVLGPSIQLKPAGRYLLRY